MFGIASHRRIPLMDVIRRLDFSGEDLSWDHEQNTETVSKERKGTDGIVLDTNETETEPAYTESMLKGMTGYQLTPADLDFINRMKEEKLLKQLQEEMEEVQRLLKREEMALELACASRDKVQADLNKFPSCDELSEWMKVVVKLTSPSMDLTDLDVKALLIVVTEEDIQRAMHETSVQIKRTQRILANRRKKEAEGRGQLEKVIATKQLEIQRMMTQLSDLTSELARQEEVYKALQTQIEASKKAKVETKEEDVEDVTEDASEVKRQRKQRKKTKETLEEATNQRKPNRRIKHVDGKTENQSGKDDTSETPTLTRTVQTKPRSVKAAKGRQRKVQEQEVKGQESVPATRGRQKSAGATKTLAAPAEQKNQTKVKRVDVLQAASSCGRGKVAVAPRDDGEQAQSAGLRRSKRIASKR